MRDPQKDSTESRSSESLTQIFQCSSRNDLNLKLIHWTLNKMLPAWYWRQGMGRKTLTANHWQQSIGGKALAPNQWQNIGSRASPARYHLELFSLRRPRSPVEVLCVEVHNEPAGRLISTLCTSKCEQESY